MIIGGLVVLALTAALVAPYFIDWSSYRSAFEREAGRILGREVQVEGTASARLLPFPSVTFTDVVVAGTEPGEPAMTVDQFSMDAEMAPFLRGEVLIFDMRLVRPRMTIEIGPKGTVDWAMRPSSPFDPRQVTLEKVTITDGRIAVRQKASDRTVTLDNIDSELSARSLAGPWRIDGSLSVDGIPAMLSAATGTAGNDGKMRVRISLQPENYPIALSTDGHAQIVDEEALYAGTFNLRTVAATEEGDVEGEEAESSSPGNRVAGRFSLDHQQLAVEEFLFQTGPQDDPYTAEGQAMVSLGAKPSFSITADGAQIRFDGSDAEGEGVKGLSADERLAAFTDFMASLPKPSIPGTVSVNLPAIVAGDTMIRNIRIEAEPVAEGWNIHSAAATLPGRTRFEGGGLLSMGQELSFDGNLILAIGQPSGFAAWLARDVDDAIRRLPSAGFAADVSLTREQQSFDNLELILGDARFEGSIDRQNPANARPSLALTLEGNQLNLEGMQAFASLFIDESGQSRLADHDVDLNLSAGPVTARGLTVEGLETALRLREGDLEIDQLTLTGLADAQISATGQIRNIGTDPTGRVDAAVIAVDLAPLVELLAQRFPGVDLIAALNRNAERFPGLFSDSEVNFVASAAGSGEAASLAISADGTAGGTNFSFSVSSEGALTDWTAADSTVSFTARNDRAAPLYALLGLPALPLDLAGAAEINLSAEGEPAEGMDTDFQFMGDGISASFDGVAAFPKEGLRAEGVTELSSGDLEPWLALAGVSFPGYGYGLPVELTANLEYSDALAVMNGITGHVAESSLDGDLNAELRDGIPHLTGDLMLETLDLGLGAEMIFGSDAIQASSQDEWPQTPFQQTVGVPFSADVALNVDQLLAGRALNATDARLDLELEQGRFAVTGVSAQIFGGSVEGSAELQNSDGTGLLSGQLSLNGASLSQLLPNSGVSGQADLGASVTASGKSVSALVSRLSGSGSASSDNLRISGIDGAAFQSLLKRADQYGIDINAEEVSAFAPAMLRSGQFESTPIQLAFTIANGVARTPPLQLDNENASMNVEASADFRNKTVAASGSIQFDPGTAGIAGSDPLVRFSARGPLGDAQMSLDTGPLAQFFTQRALEREQRRVEHMQAVLLEKQRLRREVRYFEAREAKRRAAEAERIRFERQAEIQRRAAAERERQRQAEEAASRQAEVPSAGEGGQTSQPPATTDTAEPQDAETSIERSPLPPAEDRAPEDPATGTQVGQGDIDIENLTVEQLMNLLDEPSSE